MKIGELSERSGRSVHALRYYEREGLLPNVRRDEGGRRRYTERHVLWLELLGRLQATGMTIQEMRHYADLVAAGDSTLEERQELLEGHRTRVLDQIAELKACIDLIDVKVSMYQEWLDAGGSPVEVPK